MDVKIKLVDETLPLPAYQTKGSVAFDLYSRVNTSVKPWTPTIIPLNIVAKIPEGYFLMLVARSSLAGKKGLMLANSVGIIDIDYSGDEDEIGLSVVNFTKKVVKIDRGERLAQGLIVHISKATKFKQVKTMGSPSRRGWGSTGGYKKAVVTNKK